MSDKSMDVLTGVIELFVFGAAAVFLVMMVIRVA
jgi:hypothetical protein